jgi:hypothetical protein
MQPLDPQSVPDEHTHWWLVEQVLPPVQSLFAVHWTHDPAWHFGAEDGHELQDPQ